MDSEPLLIVVDDENNALRPETRIACHEGIGILHRAFSIYLFDRHFRILLQQRSRYKKLWPLYWANSCCGHPMWDEEISHAARRRLREELGITPTLNRLFTFSYSAEFLDVGSEREMCTVFVGILDHPISPNPLEIEDWTLTDPDGLDDSIANSLDEFTPWLRQAWRIMRERHWVEVCRLTDLSIPNTDPT